MYLIILFMQPLDPCNLCYSRVSCSSTAQPLMSVQICSCSIELKSGQSFIFELAICLPYLPLLLTYDEHLLLPEMKFYIGRSEQGTY